MAHQKQAPEGCQWRQKQPQEKRVHEPVSKQRLTSLRRGGVAKATRPQTAPTGALGQPGQKQWEECQGQNSSKGTHVST